MISEFSLTPFEMKMLLHFACSQDSFESNATQALIDESRCKLADAGLIFTSTGGVRFEVSAKGYAWIEMALSTPLPVQKWVRP